MLGSPWPKRILRGLVSLVAVLALLVGGVWAAGRFDESASARTEVAGATARAEQAPTTTSTPPTTSSLPPTTTTEPPPPPLRTAQLAFTGDTLAHAGVVRQARSYAADDPDREYNFAPMFDLVESYLTGADVAICHLETPLSADNRGLSGYPTFNVPADIAAGLVAAGYDGCTTASNHSMDQRSGGVVETLDALDAVGLSHTGMARSEEERNSTRMYDAGGISVANLSYTYGLNGFSVPSDSPWMVNLIDVDLIAVDAARARADGAEYVVVSLHWGIEYRPAPSAEQRSVAEQLLPNPDIDIVIGHHAHVVQAVEEVDGKTVVFGLGNFLSNQSANCCDVGSQDGVIMQVNIQEIRNAGPDDDRFRTWLTYVPTRVDRDDFTIVPVLDALADLEISTFEERTLVASRERTRDRLAGSGEQTTRLFEAPTVAVTD
ncbi:MAG: CapA family protein [Acidimicrobiales bacterium]